TATTGCFNQSRPETIRRYSVAAKTPGPGSRGFLISSDKANIIDAAGYHACVEPRDLAQSQSLVKLSERRSAIGRHDDIVPTQTGRGGRMEYTDARHGAHNHQMGDAPDLGQMVLQPGAIKAIVAALLADQIAG